jgi:hypothetical protein
VVNLVELGWLVGGGWLNLVEFELLVNLVG